MKKHIYISLILLLITSISFAQSISQEKSVKREKNQNTFLEQKFASPSEKSTIVLENENGNIFVKTIDKQNIRVSSPQKSREELSKILELKTTEGNEIHVSSRKNKTESIDLYLEIPKESNLKITKTGKGRVEVSGLSNLIEVNSQEDIILEDVEGWANLSTTQGNINANFNKVVNEQNMTFLSLEGDITLNFPQDLKANFKVKNASTLENDFSNQQDIFITGYRQSDYNTESTEEKNELEELVITSKKDKKAKSKKSEVNRRAVDNNMATNSGNYNNNSIPQKQVTVKKADLYQQYKLPQTQNFKTPKCKVLYFISTSQGKVFIRKNKK